jgi:hypothetical protein
MRGIIGQQMAGEHPVEGFMHSPYSVTPAKAGVQLWTVTAWKESWIPAFAWMTAISRDDSKKIR